MYVNALSACRVLDPVSLAPLHNALFSAALDAISRPDGTQMHMTVLLMTYN
jgi:hypothetical protein